MCLKNCGRLRPSPRGHSESRQVASWFQSLFAPADPPPTLVGGGAVELYTGGAYRTGGLDFVGVVTKDAGRKLEQAGFERDGRHWIHRRYRLLFETPDRSLDSGSTVATIRFGTNSVVVIGLEELIVDRLAAWQFWRSEIDGYNAWRLWSSREKQIDLTRLRFLAARSDTTTALNSLLEFAGGYTLHQPAHSEIEQWTRNPP